MSDDDEVLRRLEIIHQRQEAILGRLDAIDKRLGASEDRLAELGGGLAVVLSRSKETKKKLIVLFPSFARSLSVSTGWRRA